MLRLPIAERELRIGARSNRTYSSRRNIASIVILIFALLYWNFGMMGGWAATKIFNLLSALCFVYTLFAGLILAADSISSEKREGTLGLLFLTPLKPHDLVAGTATAASLKAFCGLLAAFPILGIAFILGGVEYAEFSRVCLTLISALVFSISLSLLASSLSRNRLFSISRAALGLIIFTVLIPGLCHAVRNVIPISTPKWVNIVNLFSPSTTLELSAGRWAAARGDFWWSLFIINAVSATMLLIACLVLPWIWKDGTRGLSERFGLRSPLTKIKKNQPIRPGVRGHNPFYWLASRQSWESTKFLVGLLILGVAASIVGRFNITFGKFPAFESQLAAWSFLLTAAHAVLLFKFAALSTSRLMEDRELGALESILVTPLRVKTIIRGQWHALATQLAGPALAVLFLHGLIFWAVLTQYSLDEKVAGGAAGVLRLVFRELRHGVIEPWQLCCIAAIVVGSGIVLCLNWIALGWIGMWSALRTRHPSFVVWITLGATLVPPAAAFAFTMSAGVWLGLARGNGPYWAWFCILFGFGFCVVNAIAVAAYGWVRLRRDFRFAATERFAKPWEHKWDSMRWLLRVVAASGAVCLLILLFYGEERWRGLRGWRRLEREYAGRGEKLTTRMAMNPSETVPDAKNFGAAKIFEPLFDYRYDSSGKIVWKNAVARRELMTITLSGAEEDAWAKTKPNPRGDWALQKPADLSAWQQYFRTNATFSSLCTTGPPAPAILSTLTIYSPELEELEELSRRPYSYFPIHYNETHAAWWLHMPFLKHIADILELRATAKLSAGDPAGARSDILFCVRLSDAMKGTLGIYPLIMRMKILDRVLNPLWEGLARRQWDDDSLKAFQQELSVDLLTSYPKAVHEQTVSMVDFLDRLTQPDEELLKRLGSFPINPRAARFYPTGWRYLNQTGLFRLADDILLPFVDSREHRVFPSKLNNLSEAVRRSHVRIDPLSGVFIPWEVESLAQITLSTAHTQVSLDEAIIACALERWRLAGKTLPEALEPLRPQFIESLPCDPITGDPFRYKPLSEDRFILYSPGWDEKDDGGETAKESPSALEQDLRKGDWVWKYPDP